MEKKRNKLEVIRDILLVIQSKNGRIKPTQILYKSNLSHFMMKDYLGGLIKQGLIKESHSKSGRTYSITEKGVKYLLEYRTISNFMESFGLSETE
jgi:predicted transcriptional regulator